MAEVGCSRARIGPSKSSQSLIGEPDWKEGRTLKAWCPLLERFIPHRAIKEYRNCCTEDTSDAGDLKKRIIEYRSRLFVLPIWSFLLSTITPDLKT
ncbi:hypothetical protein Tco_1273180 [Tanacetum coccineum]